MYIEFWHYMERYKKVLVILGLIPVIALITLFSFKKYESYKYSYQEIQYDGYTLCTYERTLWKCYSNTKIVEIPAYLGLKTIGKDAFSIRGSNNPLPTSSPYEQIILPEGIINIEEYAFYQLVNMHTIELPSTLKRIEEYAFNSCYSLSELYLPDHLEYIGEGAFLYCEGLEIVEIPPCVVKIDKEAFKHCSSLSTLRLSEGLKNIEEGAFTGCSSLSAVEIPSSVKRIGNNAFDSTITLIGESGSCAEQYALSNGNEFITNS